MLANAIVASCGLDANAVTNCTLNQQSSGNGVTISTPAVDVVLTGLTISGVEGPAVSS